MLNHKYAMVRKQSSVLPPLLCMEILIITTLIFMTYVIGIDAITAMIFMCFLSNTALVMGVILINPELARTNICTVEMTGDQLQEWITIFSKIKIVEPMKSPIYWSNQRYSAQPPKGKVPQ
jgi:hypothetical protein